MINEKSEKSLPTLISDLTRETVELIRKEIELAKAELSEKISATETAVGSLAVGAIVIFAGILVLLQAVVNSVALVLPPEPAPWLAPLIVGAVVVVIGYAVLKSGRSQLKAENLKPHRTMNSLRRDKTLAQEKVR